MRETGISCCISIIAAIILAGVVALLFGLGLITVTLAIWVALAIAIFVLLALLVLFSRTGSSDARVLSRCLRRLLSCLLVGTIGTIILGIIALFVGVVAITIINITIVLLLTFFFVLMIGSIIELIVCLVRGGRNSGCIYS